MRDHSLLFAAQPSPVADRLDPRAGHSRLIVLSRVLVAVCLIGCVPVTAPQTGVPLKGRALVETNCASCHAIGRTDTSRLSAAPPFRELHKRYPIEQLAEALAEGIVTGHAGMPEFRLEPPRIDDPLSYLKTLED